MIDSPLDSLHPLEIWLHRPARSSGVVDAGSREISPSFEFDLRSVCLFTLTSVRLLTSPLLSCGSCFIVPFVAIGTKKASEKVYCIKHAMLIESFMIPFLKKSEDVLHEVYIDTSCAWYLVPGTWQPIQYTTCGTCSMFLCVVVVIVCGDEKRTNITIAPRTRAPIISADWDKKDKK